MPVRCTVWVGIVRLRYGMVRSDHIYGNIPYGKIRFRYGAKGWTLRPFAKGRFGSFSQMSNVVTHISNVKLGCISKRKSTQNNLGKAEMQPIEPRTSFSPEKRQTTVNRTCNYRILPYSSRTQNLRTFSKIPHLPCIPKIYSFTLPAQPRRAFSPVQHK